MSSGAVYVKLPSWDQLNPPRVGGELMLIKSSFPSTSKSLKTKVESITSPSFIPALSKGPPL